MYLCVEINAVQIELAMDAKNNGLCVIRITNLAHSKSVSSRHQSGKKLYQLCDIVIDNCGVIGDTSIEIGDLTCGPTSIVASAFSYKRKTGREILDLSHSSPWEMRFFPLLLKLLQFYPQVI